MAENARNVFMVVTQCEADSTAVVLDILRKIAPDAISLSSSTFLLSNEGEGFPGYILATLDPLKVKSVKAVFICTVTYAFGSSFGRKKDSAIKAILDGI